jgi:hypothetical protein
MTGNSTDKPTVAGLQAWLHSQGRTGFEAEWPGRRTPRATAGSTG